MQKPMEINIKISNDQEDGRAKGVGLGSVDQEVWKEGMGELAEVCGLAASRELGAGTREGKQRGLQDKIPPLGGLPEQERKDGIYITRNQMVISAGASIQPWAPELIWVTIILH